jgi:uncharacterized membrane protein YcaP (DUF421 family)
MVKHNMRQESIIEDELLAEVHTNGINNLDKVEEAYMESACRVSVIPRRKKASTKAA